MRYEWLLRGMGVDVATFERSDAVDGTDVAVAEIHPAKRPERAANKCSSLEGKTSKDSDRAATSFA